MVNWIEECSRRGFPRRKENILDSVQEIVKETGIKNPFSDGRPGKGWYAAFLKRHPELAVRTPEAVTQASACVTEENIRGWFRQVGETLQSENLAPILKYPKRNFNGDETNFVLCPDGKLVLAIRGMKNVYEVDPGQAKEAVTCMHSFNADGDEVPPMLIYPYQRIPADITDKIPKTWGVGRSETGWMTAEVFYEYIGNIFNTFIESQRIEKPVILFVDGHKSHLTIHTSKLCKDLDIILVALYPNATRILQPADVAAFRPIKMGWANAVREWRRTHLHEALTKKWVAPILEKVLAFKNLTQTYKNGFKATGLHPWDPDAIDYTKCLGGGNDSSNSTIQEEQERPVKSLSSTRFAEILGKDKISTLKGMLVEGSGGESPDSALHALFCMWRELGEPDAPPEAPRQSGDEQVASDQSDEVDDPQPCSSTSSIPPVEKRPVENILHWPEAPQRKGKRQTERLPFVLTSEQWQKMVEEKGEKRKAEEQAKEERKKAREEKRKEKEEEMRKKQEEKRLKEQNAKKKRVGRGGGGPRRGSRLRK